MSALPGRGQTGLLIVDVQIGVVDGAWQRDTIVARIAALAAAARTASIPVIWVQHSSASLVIDSPQWQLAEGLIPLASEPVVRKIYGDSFESTELEEVLAASGIDHLVVCGAKTNACIISTLYGGLVRGYDVTLVGDAHTTGQRLAAGLPPTDQVIALVNSIWAARTAPGRTTAVVQAADLW